MPSNTMEIVLYGVTPVLAVFCPPLGGQPIVDQSTTPPQRPSFLSPPSRETIERGQPTAKLPDIKLREGISADGVSQPRRV